MKANSRRRVLISSLAMLLVALVALSTATFAWFTQNTTAKTKNLSVYTAQSSSLEISKNDNAWGSTVDYKFADKQLFPASTIDGTNWFTGYAETGSNYASSKGSLEAIDSANAEEYYFANQLCVRNAGTEEAKNVVIEFSIPDTEKWNYARFAIVEVNKCGTTGVTPVTGATFLGGLYSNNTTQAYNGVKSVNGTGDAQVVEYEAIATTKGGTGLVQIPVGNLAAVKDESGTKVYAGKYYNIYLWFEGQDPECFDANAGYKLDDLVFTVYEKTEG